MADTGKSANVFHRPAISAWVLATIAVLSPLNPALANDVAITETQARMQDALSRLLRQEHKGSLVIFSENESGKYVRFFGSAKEKLKLDLPLQSLNGMELVRAKAFFLEFGERLVIEGIIDNPTGKLLDSRSGFSLAFGKNADKGADIAWRIFREVYEFPADFEMDVVEN